MNNTKAVWDIYKEVRSLCTTTQCDEYTCIYIKTLWGIY